MERRTNYGKIIAITIAVVAAFTAMAYVVYRLFVKDLEKAAAKDEECDDFLFEEDTDIDCQCLNCDTLTDAE